MRHLRHIIGLLSAVVLSGCFALSEPEGGGTAEFQGPRRIDAGDVLLPPGYRIEPVAAGLTFPSGIAFDGQGRPHVIEAGYSYGEVFAPARLLRLESDGRSTVVAVDEANVPWTGVSFHDGAFYVAASGQREGDLSGGRVLRITPDGRIAVLVDGLPGRGDHHTNAPVVGPDGWLYFAQGTATNSGVVGPDNFKVGWLKRFPRYNDIPCRDIVLRGVNYTSANPLTEADDTAVTGAYVPFGTPTRPGQVIKGRFPCHGAVMRVRPQGGRPELVAWGFRNPFWLSFSPDGRLFATDNSYDVRGSRPVFGTGDPLWEVKPGTWYGWPDFQAGKPLQDWNRFEPIGGKPLEPLLARYPGQPPKPAAVFAVHASANGFDFARSPAFGKPNEAFVAQFGDLSPNTGKVLAPVGFRVVKVDIDTGVIHDFAVNGGKVAGPASWTGGGGLERPVSVRFDPAGTALWVVDFGVLTLTPKGDMFPRKETGVIWRIVPDARR
ncbi:MAG TPA: hypothetical protein VD995_22610 [Azospirillum sp.]|nr:hypothetical protein [Azospirillum sp.]